MKSVSMCGHRAGQYNWAVAVNLDVDRVRHGMLENHGFTWAPAIVDDFGNLVVVGDFS